MIRAVIFDFDGLILDTEAPIFQSWQEIYQAYGVSLTIEEWSQIIGGNDISFNPLERLPASVDHQAISEQQRRRESDLIAHQPVLPGVSAYLQEAQRLGLKIGLASSSPCDWVIGHLSRLGLIDYFDCILASDDVRRTKPDPELYLAVLAVLDVPPAQAFALEDSPNGIRAARQAGLFCVAVPNPLTRQMDTTHASMHLGALSDLPLQALIEKIESLQLAARTVI
jgi:HAD superfamily hydrolase (TIGR01509 family)